MPKDRSLARVTTTNGDALRAALVTDDWSRVADLLGPLRLPPDQLRRFPTEPGSDTEPWDALLSMLALDEHTALAKLAERTGLAFIPEPKRQESAGRFYEVVPADLARAHHATGIESDGRTMTVATAQPMQPAVFSMIEDLLAMPVRIVLSPRGQVANLINRGYEQRQDLVTEIIEEMPLDESAIAIAAGAIGQSTDLLQLARQTPVIRLVNMILFEALRRRASDIHVHPQETRLIIRFRIDGMLIDSFTPPLALAPAISSRLKVMTELDIANRHSPQDGHTTVRIGSHKIDIRMSVIPTIYGERIVLRLLDQSQTQLSLDQVGMSTPMQDQLVGLISKSSGIILVTGPTGSGKTTTLYAALGKIDRDSRNVMTIEDPVEYHLEGISQMQVNAKRGVTFATGLRSLLRQDPDVILVGEVRDSETADLAIQASLTGHLVLATLHTNDAPSAIPRLVDIGVEPYLVTSSLLAVAAQRLLRRVCTVCGGTGDLGRSALRADSKAQSRLGEPTYTQRCEACFGTGYKGRLAVYEIMPMNDELRTLTGQRADAVALAKAAHKAGFKTMVDDARDKAARGLTTEEEIRRVLL
ncbi:MAG: type II/IV secretion system protein [Phycisphaerales bacterium]|nr:type II/IV secretion system protein [Phycisphaerales bacterium]